MMSEKELEAALYKIQWRIDEVNRLYLQKVGEQVNEIGKLAPASVHKLIQMRKAGTSIDKINSELHRVTGKNTAEVYELYKQALTETYTDYEFTAIARGRPLIPLKYNTKLQNVLESMSRETAELMYNLSNTTNISSQYKEIVSDAVQAAVSGVGDYNSAMRSALRCAAEDGARVTYESGVTRRLDTAIRMNIVDGVKHIQQEAQHIIGEQIGADGVELTAHPNSAPDHEPCQGRQFTKAEFEKMQSGADFADVDGKAYQGFQRPIGEWNCNHFAFDIVLGISKRMHSEEELEQWCSANNEGCTIDGEHYTNYEAGQLMRQLETKVRRQKDVAAVAKASGDDILRRQAQSKITQYTEAYKRVADASGLATRFERMNVAGFKDTKSLQGKGDNAIIMPLPGFQVARIPTEKFTEYALNPAKSPNKAKAFYEALGYSKDNSDDLIKNIRDNLGIFNAVEKPDNGYGKRFEVLMTLTGLNGKSARVKTAWIIDNETGETRLTSAYVTSKKGGNNED